MEASGLAVAGADSGTHAAIIPLATGNSIVDTPEEALARMEDSRSQHRSSPASAVARHARVSAPKEDDFVDAYGYHLSGLTANGVRL